MNGMNIKRAIPFGIGILVMVGLDLVTGNTSKPDVILLVGLVNSWIWSE